MEVKINLNHFAILAASFVNFLLAFVWYGPLFGETWAIGAEVSNPETPPIWATITSFIVGVMSSYGFAIILMYSKKFGVADGLKIGALVSLAFLLQVIIGPWLFSGRFLLFAVNMPYFTLTALISGLIIGKWQKPHLNINPKS
ncbi:DUF1761 domain-containing protein [Flagellimonas sp.]|uniref:DUF1761 domain-containing protein n=1 Tax=Flagellimonas sp. TaxID=2058762 RepID=UPI003BB0DFAC